MIRDEEIGKALEDAIRELNTARDEIAEVADTPLTRDVIEALRDSLERHPLPTATSSYAVSFGSGSMTTTPAFLNATNTSTGYITTENSTTVGDSIIIGGTANTAWPQTQPYYFYAPPARSINLDQDENGDIVIQTQPAGKKVNLSKMAEQLDKIEKLEAVLEKMEKLVPVLERAVSVYNRQLTRVKLEDTDEETEESR